MFVYTYGLVFSEAKKMAENMLNQVIDESKKDGTYYLQSNLGDIILGEADCDNEAIKKIADNIKKSLPKKKKEGVKDEDIRWWWNLKDIERRMMLKIDDLAKVALMKDEFVKSGDTSIAAAKVKKFHPIYGDPDDTRNSTGADSPLPFELKNRINIYIEKQQIANDVGKYRNTIIQSSSFNALVRKEIRAGNL